MTLKQRTLRKLARNSCMLLAVLISGMSLATAQAKTATQESASPSNAGQSLQQNNVLDDLGEIPDEQNDSQLPNALPSDSNGRSGELESFNQSDRETGREAERPLPTDQDTSQARANPSVVKGPRGYLKIPSPRPGGRVVDLTGRVTDDELKKINALCTEIYEKSGSETTCVLIPSTGGQDLREYATNLFNSWGVGSQFRNNGMLIFVSLDEAGAEVILGSAIDSDQQVSQAQKLMNTIMVPRFVNGEVGSAVYAGARACATQVYSIAHLESPKDIASSKIRKSTGRIKNWLVDFGPIPWIVGGTLLSGVALVGGRHWWRYRPRVCETCRDYRVMLSEAEDDKFLDPPEIIEERIGTVDYDVWACLECETVLKLRYGRLFTRYSDCPQCNYKTRLRIERTIVSPTTISGGRVRVIEECENCTYHKNWIYHTPKIPKPKSGSFSGGGRSGRGFSSGGGRSSGFGGGRSAGRGASGRW